MQCWQNICATLNHLRSLANNSTTTDTITRVNNLINNLSKSEDPLETQDPLRHSHKKLINGISEIREAADKEVKFVLFCMIIFVSTLLTLYRTINEALEQVGILLALRQAPDMVHQGMYNFHFLL